MKISLIIPIYNEEVLIRTLFERCINSLKEITDDYEIICVNDGSTDNSLRELLECHKENPQFKILVLSRNFGHQAAYTAGLSYAKGDYIVMMDGDMQDPPELIPLMQEKLVKNNLDAVYGKRIERKETRTKRILIKIFHKIFRKFSRLTDAENVGNFSIFNRKVLKAILLFKERKRYLPGLRFLVGFRQDYIEYTRPGRELGKSKMTFCKLFDLAMDAIYSFSDLPIKICLYLGLIGVITFFLGLFYSLVSKIIGIAPYGWSSIVLSIYFLGSVQLVFLGIIGEYVFRIYTETQKRPLFIVDKFID